MSRQTRSGGTFSRKKQQLTSRESRDLLLNVFDALLVILICVCPFFMAGRQPVGQMLYTIVAGLLVVTWCLRQQTAYRRPWIFTGLEPLVLGILILCGLQLVPLPVELLHKISPHHADVTPVLNTHVVGQQAWQTISFSLYDTATNFISILMLSAAGFVVRQRVRNFADIKLIAAFLMSGVTLMVIFAWVQYATSNGLFFWYYRHPLTNTLVSVKGSFTNSNHFAGFACAVLPLVIISLLAIVIKSDPGQQWNSRKQSAPATSLIFEQLAPFGIIGVIILLLTAAVMSQSRGAIIQMGCEILVLLVALIAKRMLDVRLTFSLLLLSCVAAGGLFMFADRILEQNTQELLDFQNVEKLDPNQGRRIIWLGNLRMIQNFTWLGTGLGTHCDIHGMFTDKYINGIVFTHAENSYLNIASEAGVIVLTFVMLILFSPCCWCLRTLFSQNSKESQLIAMGTLAGLIAMLVNAIYDFNFYAPAIGVEFMILAVISHANMRDDERPVSVIEPVGSMTGGLFRSMRSAMVVAVVVIATTVQMPAAVTAQMWDEYVFYSREIVRDDTRSNLFVLKFNRLNKLLQIHPYHAQAQTAMAGLYIQAVKLRLQQDENRLGLQQIHDASFSGGFQTAEELLAWINRDKILGDQKKVLDAAWQRCLLSLRLNPVIHNTYLNMQEVAFTQGYSWVEDEALLKQARSLAPFDSSVDFAWGGFSLMKGNADDANQYFKQAFTDNKYYAKQIMGTAAASMSAEEFITIFDPDLYQMSQLAEYYIKHKMEDHQKYLSPLLAKKALESVDKKSDREKVALYLLATQAYDMNHEDEPAYEMLCKCYELAPHDEDVRRKFGMWLYDRKRYPEALAHIEWVYQHTANNIPLRPILENCKKLTLTASGPKSSKYD
jgi:Tfp pilus assembly protein PilF